MMSEPKKSPAFNTYASVFLLAVGALSNSVAGDDSIPRIGESVPAFESIDDQGRLWKSSEHVGMQFLVIYFYQGDFKFCAIRQAQKYRDRMTQFAERNVSVVGISGDTVETHRLFKQIHGLDFTLLSDERGEIAKLLGVPLRDGGSRPIHDGDGKVIGVARRGVTATRVTFIIGRDGTILDKNSSVSPLSDSQDVLQFIDSLRKTSR